MIWKLFGDSLVEELELFLRRSGDLEAQLISPPGKGSREIRRVVEKAPAAKSDLVIITANDIDL